MLTATGDYNVYLAGSFAGAADVGIDDHKVGTARGLANAGNYVPVGRMHLVSGAHIVTTSYHTHVLAPGSGAPYSEIGFVVLEPVGDHTKIQYVAPKDYTRLCSRSLDWIEARRPVTFTTVGIGPRHPARDARTGCPRPADGSLSDEIGLPMRDSRRRPVKPPWI